METNKRKRRKQLGLYSILLLLITVILLLLENRHLIVQNKVVGNVEKESISSISLDASSYSLKLKDSRRIPVIAKYSDGSSKNVSKRSVYSTSDKKIVSVNSTGLITAVAPGFASIQISYEGVAKTIAVSVSSKSLHVNVKDFGAYGNGKHDDTRAIQKAIDHAAAKGGGDVFIPKGTYILHPIFLKSKVNLVGESRDIVTLKLSNQASDDYTRVVNLINVSNVKIQSLTIDGNSKKHPKGIEHMHCIFAWDSKNIFIDNNRLIHAVGDGISISGSEKSSNKVIISNNILVDNHRSNIVLEQVNHLQIFNNTSTSKVGRPALHFEPWEKISFNDAKIWDNTFSSNTEGYCVQLEGGKDEGNFYYNVDFFRNKITCTAGQFLVMETKNAKVYQNMLNVASVYVWIKNEDLQIYNNNIHSRNGIVIEGTWGILSKGTQIFKNSIMTKGNGLSIAAGSQNTKIYQNSFTGTGKTGVYLFATATNITKTTVSDNTFKNFEYGIFTDYNYYDNKRITGLLVRGNTFANIDEYALYIKGTTSNVTFDKNKVVKASGVNILANDRLMSNILVSNNIISGGEQGIVQTQSGNGFLKSLTISGNIISNSTAKGDMYSTGAAIELAQNSIPPSNVLIKKNKLINNIRNFITVPKSLADSIKK
ncbi:right-handed parallel beta-helix repeat-containing protein [Neobacillus cucumis]|uniref:BIG2 domain-containing protein n=1 Tax=Neobacillus cucumis TaxID=1740721 RepID=A0A2N5H6F4_9BACI|nr:right-handed parallel beta-helix repeat-containing protein [Neobacillus cucumis]PLS01103.1 hypothetical protein CVD27_27365 [Neobacillus cucumis]